MLLKAEFLPKLHFKVYSVTSMEKWKEPKFCSQNKPEFKLQFPSLTTVMVLPVWLISIKTIL